MLFSLGIAVAGILIPVAVYMLVKFPPPLTVTEQALLAFSPETVEFTPRTWKPVTVMCPVRDTGTQGAQELQAGVMPTPVISGYNQSTTTVTPEVTCVFQDAGSSMAIIDGLVLKAGDSFPGGKVLKIEQQQVLIQAKKGKSWLRLE